MRMKHFSKLDCLKKKKKKWNSSFLDSSSKCIKIIHKELEFPKLEFYSNGTRVS